MKNIILLSFAALTLFSCTKTKNVIVDVHDTTVITKQVHDTSYYHEAILGSWRPITSSTASPTFTLDSVSWDGAAPYRYVASGDTLYRAYSNAYILPEHYYAFSKNYDTLTMHEFAPYNSVLIFTR